MDPEIFSKPGHWINRAARLHLRLGEPKLQQLGLAVAQLPVLGALKDGRSLSQTELARLVRIEQPTMAQLLARMERDGLIRRTPDPEDKRSSLISLTPAAIRKIPLARSLILKANEVSLEGFSEREIATLTRLLQRVVQNLEDELKK